MQITLRKTLENAVKFAQFCREYNVSPRRLANVMQLCKELPKAGYEKRVAIQKHVESELLLMGFEKVNFYKRGTGEPEFCDSGGMTLLLPEV